MSVGKILLAAFVSIAMIGCGGDEAESKDDGKNNKKGTEEVIEKDSPEKVAETYCGMMEELNQAYGDKRKNIEKEMKKYIESVELMYKDDGAKLIEINKLIEECSKEENF